MRVLITEPISDASLLERFASRRDEAAFGELVKRHGPQVLKICRLGLFSEHDVEDVFQATFVVLAHKAAAICWTESVESWLCAVARRLVLHARASAWRRQRRERPVTALAGAWAEENGGDLPEIYHPLCDPHEEIERRDVRRVLHAALGQLPDKYRDPVVLCYLEGLTNEQAARRLGWPAGTISRRLQRARSLLRQQTGPQRFDDCTHRLCRIRAGESRTVRAANSTRNCCGASGNAVAAPSRGCRGQTGSQASASTWRRRGFPGSANSSRRWLVRFYGLPSRPPIKTPAKTPNSGFSTRPKCAWLHSILARRPGSAIEQPYWERPGKWT